MILVGDIERCGIFAQIIGTVSLLPEQWKRRIKGIIVNKFRGDTAFFRDGVAILEQKTGIPVLGVIPFYRNIHIDSEDALPLDSIIDPPLRCMAFVSKDKINVGVIYLPHVSNISDFHPLQRNAKVNLHYLYKARNLFGYDLVVIPGSKNVMHDMKWLNEMVGIVSLPLHGIPTPGH